MRRERRAVFYNYLCADSARRKRFPLIPDWLSLERMSSIPENRIEVALRIVEDQKDLFSRFFGNVASEWKGDGSRVTEADHALSNSLKDAFAREFPDDAFLSEELPSGELSVDSEYAWLVDPIDGTNNFARGLNTCSISVGLLRDGDPIYGCIYDHSFKAIFHGGPGKGLSIGNRQIQPRREPISKQSIVASQESSHGSALEESTAVTSHFKTRALGSSALHIAYVAAGMMDGSIAHLNHSWDIAAGVALLKATEADIHYLDESPFPMKTFNTASKPFGYITGSPSMITAIRDVIDR